MDSFVIIVAGGTGQRMGGSTAKQLLTIAGRPVLMHTLSCFHGISEARIVLVLHSSLTEPWVNACKEYNFSTPHDIVIGGHTRFHSVKNGLDWIFSNYAQRINDKTLIAIHDGVRPLVDKHTIETALKTAEIKGTAIPAIKSRDSLRIQKATHNESIPRENVWIVQTPQVFQALLLREAYSLPYHARFTDDASVVEYSGHAIHLCNGNIQNIKITYPMDIVLAENLLGQNQEHSS